jgi:hypothetical protein
MPLLRLYREKNMIPRECRFLLRAASVLVPARLREDWLARWEGELWYAQLRARREGKSDSQIRASVVRRAWSALPDCLWQRFDRDRSSLRALTVVRHPLFALAGLVIALLTIGAASGWYTHLRRAFEGPSWDRAGRVMTITSSEALFSRRLPLLPYVMDRFIARSTTLQHVGAYKVVSKERVLVTPSFFNIVAVRPLSGKLFHDEDFRRCEGCVVVAQRYAGRVQGRVIGVLPDDFWFLNPDIGVFELFPPLTSAGKVTGIATLRLGVTPEQAAAELHRLAPADLVKAELLADRLRTPLQTYGSGTLLLFGIVSLFTALALVRLRNRRRYWLFFWAKCGLGLAAILLFALEFTGIGALTLTAGGRLWPEVTAFWTWAVASSLYLWWAIRDQKIRCRTCQRRLIMPVRIGPPDRVLFEHEGTELICSAGHGTLYLDGMTETFRKEGHWTRLDESWQDIQEAAGPKP